MAGPIRVLSEGPLTVVTFYSAASDEEYAKFLEEMTVVMRGNRGKYRNMVVVHDASRWMRSTPKQRQMQAAWIKQHEPEMKNVTAGVTFVLSSAIVRGMFTALMWLTPMPTDHVITATLGESFDWARKIQGKDFPEGFAQKMLLEAGVAKTG